MWNKTIAWLLGLEEVELVRVEGAGLSAAWAQGNGFFWVLMACAALAIIAMMFYLRFQRRGTTGSRVGLAICRGLLLALLFITLADPFIRLYEESFPRPLVYVLFDGTQSMEIEDDLPPEQRKSLEEAVGFNPADENAADTTKPAATRLNYVKSLVGRKDNNLFRRLQDEKGYRIEAFTFTGNNTSQLRRLELNAQGDQIDPDHLVEQLSADGQVTALGSVIDELNQQLGKGNLAGVVMFSDYATNSGIAPVGSDDRRGISPVMRLNVPIHTVGIGATQAADLKVDVRPDIKMKRAERSSVNVRWEQMGLAGKTVAILVTARRLDGPDINDEIIVGRETITLDENFGTIDLPFTPEEAGRLEFTASVDVQEGEVIEENNRSQREVNVIDDYLRLMYVAYEPNWEWRFVKEVFHRDKLVGMRGFRTFLRSADPKIRQYNDLFLPTLTPKRSEFFANDIIFLGDMPSSAISERFGEMTREFVSEFGGGLVVIAGPRFGPGQLANSPIADMLPVEVDPGARRRDNREFRLQLTPQGMSTDFMQLGDADDDAENLKAWDNLGELPWYQPVRKPHSLADVLAEHPSDVCIDGKTRQPLIAIRKYGKGEVVYLAMDEMWRLRRRYGELYYRQFWSQIMNRLALSHALGDQKRFVVRTDRPQYKIDDQATVIVEAYDENFERLSADKLADKTLQAEVIMPQENGGAGQVRNIALTQLRPGEFESRLPVALAGEYRVRVKDPIEEEYSEVRFRVENVSAERRDPERDEYLQQRIADESNGRSYDLTTVNNLVDDLQLTAQPKKSRRIKPLWATPLWFMLVVGLMLGEWFFRKMMHMA